MRLFCWHRWLEHVPRCCRSRSPRRVELGRAELCSCSRMRSSPGRGKYDRKRLARSRSTFGFQILSQSEIPSRKRHMCISWRLGTACTPDAGDLTPPDFASQCEALLNIAPLIVSSVMGLYPRDFITSAKSLQIKWCANITTVAEARDAEDAGADLIVAQGSEAGGHRGCFNAADAERKQVGLFALLPAVVDAVRLPVVATGGIADARGIAAAFTLGASAVQIGTGFLCCPEAQLHPAWATALGHTAPEDTVISRVFSGRAGRSIATKYVLAALEKDAPAPRLIQCNGDSPRRCAAAQRQGDVHRMQAWAGQSAALAKPQPAAALVRELWESAEDLLR